ncbi:MAG: putative viral A-type inclusion protein [SAR86 cluster bacterium SAR86A]|jgi:cell division protein FtsI/penicillin-binding protein 2|uniref:Putative viral A-type inclusion protein n=1 Tax=SAR86 cluster bacterium SAR86A TaxID=1123866 RepID=J5KG59_9GAMM|nr:MAG: putative viral A-type inclusion protein [SAR86 cluster bacterium SAR86A]|tara:strand:+ start:1463 stop:2101 length:639 start_codon:yes stop_codon:yes gene_type:complete
MKVERKFPEYLKRANNGGLLVGFIYVLVFMSILFLWIWQTFETENDKSLLNTIDERLNLIEEQINIVDETNNDTITDISSSIQFLDKEVRKLWDLSNKRNKVNIQKLSDQAIKIEEILQKLQTDVDNNQTNLLKMRNSIETNMQNIENLGLSEEDLNSIRMNISSIDTQLMLLDDTVQALNNYKNQLNQTILEIQTQISSSEDLNSVQANEN